MRFDHMAKLLRRKREQVMISQNSLSKKLSLHVQCISNWERGIATIPAKRIKDISRILKINPKDLLKYMQYDFIENTKKKAGL